MDQPTLGRNRWDMLSWDMPSPSLVRNWFQICLFFDVLSIPGFHADFHEPTRFRTLGGHPAGIPRCLGETRRLQLQVLLVGVEGERVKWVSEKNGERFSQVALSESNIATEHEQLQMSYCTCWRLWFFFYKYDEFSGGWGPFFFKIISQILFLVSVALLRKASLDAG